MRAEAIHFDGIKEIEKMVNKKDYVLELNKFYSIRTIVDLVIRKEENTNINIKELEKSFLIQQNNKIGFVGKFLIKTNDVKRDDFIKVIKRCDDFEVNEKKFITKVIFNFSKEVLIEYLDSFKKQEIERKNKENKKIIEKFCVYLNKEIKKLVELKNNLEELSRNENLIDDIEVERAGSDYDYKIIGAYFENYKVLNRIENKIKIYETKDNKLLHSEITKLIVECENAKKLCEDLLKSVENAEIIDKLSIKVNDVILKIKISSYIDENTFLYDDEAFAVEDTNNYLVFKNVKNKFLKVM